VTGVCEGARRLPPAPQLCLCFLQRRRHDLVQASHHLIQQVLLLLPPWILRRGFPLSPLPFRPINLHGREVDVGLPGKGNSNSHGARPVHLIITMIKRIRASKLSIKNSLSAREGRRFCKATALLARFFLLKSTPHENSQLQNSSLPLGQRCVQRGQFLWGVDFSGKSWLQGYLAHKKLPPPRILQ